LLDKKHMKLYKSGVLVITQPQQKKKLNLCTWNDRDTARRPLGNLVLGFIGSEDFIHSKRNPFRGLMF